MEDDHEPPTGSVYKVSVTILVGLTVLASVALVVFSFQAHSSDEFLKLSVMFSVVSDDAFNTHLAALTVLVLGLLVLVAGLCGLYGACGENRCFLCGFSGLSALSGVSLLVLCAVMTAFLKAGSPVVLKEVNRVCAAEAEATPGTSSLRLTLGCEDIEEEELEEPEGEQESEQNAEEEEEEEGERNGTLRRLLSDDDGMAGSGGSLASWLGPMAWLTSNSAIAYAVAAEVASSRRLMPGATEESLLLRTCSRLGRERCPSPCALVDLLCHPPEDFDPLTACMCDRSGPHAQVGGASPGGTTFTFAPCPSENPMCAADIAGRRRGVFCMVVPAAAVAAATATAATDTEEEACFVLPTAECSAAHELGTMCGGDSSLCMSFGPCTDPPSRSRLLLEGKSLALRVIYATGILGAISMLASLCACCSCCQLHSGRGISEHLELLSKNEPLPFDDDDGAQELGEFPEIPTGLPR